jgi:hypothetical protein
MNEDPYVFHNVRVYSLDKHIIMAYI